MEMSCSDVCEVVIGRVSAMGLTINADDPDHSDVLEALGKVTFIKDEDVPLVRVCQMAFDDPHEQYVVINLNITFTGEYGSEVHALTLSSFDVEFATPDHVAKLIETARKFATEKSYRLQIDVKPSDYEVETPEQTGFDCTPEDA